MEDPGRRRRTFIAASGAGVLAGLVTREASAEAEAPTSLALTPQVTEGPFYLAAGLVRADVTEGIKGVPLDVRINVVGTNAKAFENYRVDLWHCDASGLYSGFDGQGTGRSVSLRGKTFLRGTTFSDRDGVALFHTVYPGWYAGRTTHVHFKVFNGNRVVLTSQLFLPDALSEYLYTNLPLYQRTTLRDTLNHGDGIALEAGSSAYGSVREVGDRYVLTATAVVDPDARPQAERPPGLGDRPPRRDRAGGAGGAHPGFQLGNQGGGVRGSVGLGFGGGAGGGRGGPGGPPREAPPPPSRGLAGTAEPFGPRAGMLRGDDRVAAIVPGGLQK